MKNDLFPFVLIILVLGSVKAFGQDYQIKLKIRNTTDTIAYLGNHFADKRYLQDTVTIENDMAVFTNTEAYKPGLYFYYTPASYFEFIVNEPSISLETEGENYVENMIVHQSKENEIFLEMQKYVSSKRQAYQELANQLENDGLDSLQKLEIQEQIMEIDEEVKSFQTKLAEENGGTLTSRMIRAMQKPVVPDSLIGSDADMMSKRYLYYKNHFFDGVDIADASLLRTPIMHQKIMEYLDDVIVQIPDTVIAEMDKLLTIAAQDPEVYRYALVTFTSKYEASPMMGMDEVFVHLVDNYYLNGKADWVDKETLTKMSERVATIKPNFIGNSAPKFTLNDTLNNSVALYDINAEYTVLYFYDPDCGHCKKKTPVLHEAYADLKNKDVEVVAICTTTNTDRWKEYISENGLDWINLADSYNKSNFRYYYDIRSTPVIYILDRDKKILAKRLDASQVKDFIDRHQNLESGG